MFKFNPLFYADVRIEDRYETSIVYKNKLLEAYKLREEKRAFIRVFDGNIWYYSSTSDIGKIQLELDNLYKQAKPCPDIAENKIVKKLQVNRKTLMRFDRQSVRVVPKAEKIKLAESFLPLISSPLTVMSRVVYGDRSSNYEFYSSKGADIKFDYQLCGFIVFAALSTGKDFVQASFQQAKPFFSELSGFESKLAEVFEKAENYVKNAKPCVKGKFPVVLSPTAAGVFAHESFGHKSEADFMVGDAKMAEEWALGKKVGSDILSIADSGVDFGGGYVPFDDEGTAASKTYLIKNGKLAGRLHSAFTAALMDEEVTGNARAVDCRFEPIVRMTNTYIEKGKSTFEGLISEIDDGYYIHSVSHGSGESTFTLAPLIAYEIKNGKIGDPVKISVVSGNVFETLGLIDGLSSEVEIINNIGGGCGKMEQYPLHVAFGGPYVRVSKMDVQ